MRSSWHRPGCQWVRSNGDPQATPRDKDCPACQEEVGWPFELSQKELAWQKHLENVRKALDNHPFETMFGYSNRLRNSLWDKARSPAFPWSILSEHKTASAFSEDKWPHQREVANDAQSKEEPKQQNVESKMAKQPSNVTGREGFQNINIHVHKSPEASPSAPTDQASQDDPNKYTGTRSSSKPNVIGSLAWSRSVITSGKRYDDSGTMEYDPISMCMVPKGHIHSGQPEQPQVEKTMRHLPKMENLRPQASHDSRYNSAALRKEVDSENSEFSQQVRAKEQKYREARRRLTEAKTKEQSPTEPEVAKRKVSGPEGEESETVHRLAKEAEDVSKRARTMKQAYAQFKNNHPFSSPLSRSPISSAENAGSRGLLVQPMGPDTNCWPGSRERDQPMSLDRSNRVIPSQLEDRVEDFYPRTQMREHDLTKSKHAGQETSSENEKLTQRFDSAIDAWKRFKNGPGRHQPRVDEEEVRREKLKEAGNYLTMQHPHPIFDKSKPLKQMSAREFNHHKVRLCESWTRKRSSAKPVSPVDRKLQEEVGAQKQAMQAFENRWSHTKSPSGYHASSPSPLSKAAKPELLAGEGDMSANVADFADKGKWYKKPSASFHEQRARDRELVRNVQKVYEDAYGSIEPKHRQGNLKNDADKVAQTNAMFEDLGGADDAHFARFLNSNQMATTMPKKTDTSSAEKLVADPPSDLNVTQEVQSTRPDSEPMTINSQPPVNPVDGTTRQLPDLTPQTGNFASPTGFVNHDVPLSETASSEYEKPYTPHRKVDSDNPSPHFQKPDRLVRKEEPVFSGSLANQRYSIPEIVGLLNKQGLASSERAQPERRPFGSNGSGNGDHGSKKRDRYRDGFEKGQRHHRRTLVRKLGKMLLFGGWTAACCYAIGVVSEYFRSGPVGGYPVYNDDSAPEGWETTSWVPGRRQPQGGGKFWSSGEGSEQKVAEKREARVGVLAEMPLRGFEFPLMGLLAWSVWFLVSGGGS